MITAGSAARFSFDGAADHLVAAALGIPALVMAPAGAVVARRVPGRVLQLAFSQVGNLQSTAFTQKSVPGNGQVM